MKARVVYMEEKQPDIAALKCAGRIIRIGGLVAFPTETVYGVGGNALDTKSVGKIYEAKGRPSDNPLTINIADFEDIYYIVRDIPEEAKKLAKLLWPGPLTMIFKKKDTVPTAVTGGSDTVAVRIPANEIARAVIRAAGGYVAAPSANISGRPSPTKAEHVINDLGDRVDMIIDSGSSLFGIESTIVDFTAEEPVILRPGYYSAKQLEKAAGIKIAEGVKKSSKAGCEQKNFAALKYKHYSVNAEMTVFEGEKTAVADRIKSLVKQNEGCKVAIICSDETKMLYGELYTISLGSISDENAIAARLFEVLRELNESDIECIYCETFYTEKLGDAIMNRLLKAADEHLVKV